MFFDHIIPDLDVTFCSRKQEYRHFWKTEAAVPMLARAGTAKKAASKFEDSESSHMSRPRY